MNQFIDTGHGFWAIVLPCGSIALIDSEDVPLAKPHHWRRTTNGYVVSSIDKRVVWMHRFLTKAEEPLDVDHENTEGLDNRRKVNLRVCPRAENLWNSKKHKDSSSPYKGVTFRKDTSKWFARIMVHGKVHHLGQFDTAGLAFEARKKAATELHGVFARSE